MVITGYLFQVVKKKFKNEGSPVDHGNAKLKVAKVRQKKTRQKASED